MKFKNLSRIAKLSFLLQLILIINLLIIQQVTNPVQASNFTRQNTNNISSILITSDTDFLNQAGSYGWSGDGSLDHPFIIQNLFFDDSAKSKNLIQIQNTRVNFILKNMQLIGGIYGIYMNNVSNGLVINCSVSNPLYNPIYLYQNENITISDSFVFDSGAMSPNVLIDYSTNITIFNNTIYNSDSDGVKFRDSILNTIINNTIFNNKNSGIVLGHVEKISIKHNIIENNLYRGISIEGDSKFSLLFNNLISSNTESGTFVLSQNTTITENTFYKNIKWGLKIDTASSNTSVFQNNFIENYESSSFSQQISDTSQTSKYYYNYFSDYTGPDENKDGIVDSPLEIFVDNSLKDEYPLTTAYLTSFIHILTKPNLHPFTQAPPYSGNLLISWGKASDTYNHSINYSIYFSNDNKTTWKLVEDNIDSTSFLLNTSKYSDSNDCFLKIIAIDNSGLTSFSISDQAFEINNHDSIISQPTTKTDQTNSKNINGAFTLFTALSLLIIYSSITIFRKKSTKRE